MEADFARQYYEAARSDHWWFRGRAELVRSLVQLFDLGEGLVLDLGAGSNSLFPSQFDVVKLDVVRPGGDLDHFVQASATSLPFGDGTFRGLGAFDLIEHIADSHLLLGEVFRVLAPGGFLLATVPAHQFLWSAHDVRVGHITRYSQTMLKETLANAGFQTAWCASFYGFLIGPALIRKVLDLDSEMGSPSGFQNRWLGALAVRSARRAIRGSNAGLSIGILGFRPR